MAGAALASSASRPAMRTSLRYAAQLVTWAGIAFAAASIFASIADAEPHFAPHAEHFEPHGHFEPHHDFGPHVRFDDHFHRDHFYPALGFAIGALPLGYYTVHNFDGDYYFHAGVWYRHEGPNYVVVEPPHGVVVPVLPPDYTTLWSAGAPYYYANGVYYAAAPGGYTVVQPPANATPTPPVQAGIWYYCDSAKNYYPYVAQCAEGWRTVPATPPNPG
jgi:hypothetical protein